MNKRPLIITSLIILLIAAAAIVISNLNSTTYTVTCKSKEEGCSYSHKSSSGKVLLSKDFKYEDVMQCNLETRYKPDKIILSLVLLIHTNFSFTQTTAWMF